VNPGDTHYDLSIYYAHISFLIKEACFGTVLIAQLALQEKQNTNYFVVRWYSECREILMYSILKNLHFCYSLLVKKAQGIAKFRSPCLIDK
jgi:hypothetical protein